MAQLVSEGSKRNPITAFWNFTTSFIWEFITSLDSFTKVFLIISILVISVTPIIVKNRQTINQYASRTTRQCIPLPKCVNDGRCPEILKYKIPDVSWCLPSPTPTPTPLICGGNIICKPGQICGLTGCPQPPIPGQQCDPIIACIDPLPTPTLAPTGCHYETVICSPICVSGRPCPTCAPKLVCPTPTTAPNIEKIIRRVGEREGSFLIQKINRSSVDGLWYQAYPVATNQGSPKTLYVGDDIGYACEGVSEKLTSIDFFSQTVTFTKVVGQPPYGGCPICLSGKTLIDTPSGSVSVKDMQIGMPVWTTDKSGHRISGTVIKTSKVPVPPTHQIVHIILNDGRELFVSPGHPTIDGRMVGNLIANDLYNGARVVTSERVAYDETATYDILPSGETGFYWANGILLNSTLH